MRLRKGRFDLKMVEISSRGKWVRVPGFECYGKNIIVQGTWLRTARVHDEAWLDSELQYPERCIATLRSRNLGVDIFTFSQLPPGRPPEYEYCYECDSIAAIPLTSWQNWWMGLPQETRKNVRRSQRDGVRITIRPFDDTLIHELVALNNSSAIRQGRRFTHYAKSFEEVKKDHLSFLDRSEFFCAYFDDELIGYIKLVQRGTVASILNILTNEARKDKRPANALLEAVVKRCFEKQLTHVTYGFFHHGNKQDESITQFKIRHGFAETLVPRYFVPLTAWGKLCLHARFHRGLIGVLPAPILGAALAFRASCYRRCSRILSRCSSKVEQPNRNRQMECSNPPAGSTSS